MTHVVDRSWVTGTVNLRVSVTHHSLWTWPLEFRGKTLEINLFTWLSSLEVGANGIFREGYLSYRSVHSIHILYTLKDLWRLEITNRLMVLHFPLTEYLFYLLSGFMIFDIFMHHSRNLSLFFIHLCPDRFLLSMFLLSLFGLYPVSKLVQVFSFSLSYWNPIMYLFQCLLSVILVMCRNKHLNCAVLIDFFL